MATFGKTFFMKGALLIFSLSLVLSVTAQDKILTMGGQLIECEIVDDLGIDIRYIFTKKNGKVKDKRMHRSDIFSITRAGQEEQVLYAKDEALGDWLTVEEMRIFIAGEQDAQNNYDVKWITIGGVGTGAILAYAAQGGLMVTIAGPVLYTIAQLIPVIRIEEETMSDLSNQYNEVYALGYERVARSKRVVAGLKSSAIGMLAGIVTWILVPLTK